MNNTETLSEVGGLIESDDSYAIYSVTGAFTTLQLIQVQRADLDGNGFINSVDEDIINTAILTDTYNSAADINADGLVDDLDMAIFLSQRVSSSQVAKYSFTGLTDTYDYFVSRTAEGRYLFEEIAEDGDKIISDIDGILIADIDGADYYMSNVFSTDASEMSSFSIQEDDRLFHFNNGTDEIGYASTLQRLPSTLYDVKGSNLDDVMMELPRQGLAFDGDGDYVRIDDSGDFTFNNSLTVAMWVKVDGAIDSYRGAAAQYQSSAGYSWIMRTSQNGDGRFTPYIGTSTGGYNLSSQVLPQGEWVHIAMTYDGQTMKAYVNGELDSFRVDVSGELNNVSTYATIGCGHYASHFFDGDIDDVALFNRVLSEEEMAELVRTSLTGKEEGLAAYYSLNGGSAADGTGRGNDGLIYGETMVFQDVARSTKVEGLALEYQGDVYDLIGSDGAWQLTNGTDTITFDADNMTVIDGLKYRLTGIEEEQIRIEGPISESIHVTAKEKAYVVTGTDISDMSVSELTFSSEKTGEDVVAIDIAGQTMYYRVKDIADGHFEFSEGIYPPIATTFDGTYTTFKTHRTIELEGTEYRISYDATTGTYGLYDGLGGSIEGLVLTAEGTYTTDIGGIVYSIKGTSADDFLLESVIDTTFTTQDNIISIDGDELMISQEDKVLTPRESTALMQKAIALPGTDRVLLSFDDFSDRDLDGWRTFGSGSWYVKDDHLNQGFYHNTSYHMNDDMRVIFMYNEEGVLPEMMDTDNLMITAQVHPYDWHIYNNNSGYSGADLFVRYEDENNWYRMRFNESDVVNIERMHEGTVTTLASVNVKTEYGIDIKEDEWREFSFGVWGNELKAYVSGTEVLRVVDTEADKRIESGYVGLGCPPDARTYYDDIEIERTDLTDNVYYDVAEIGGAFTTYAFTDASLSAVYTSNAEGTEVTIAGTAYNITREAGDIVLTLKEGFTIADLDQDGDIDADDKAIIDTALAGGQYDPAADVNADLMVDEVDYMLFRTEYATTSGIGVHTIPGQIVDDDYYVTRTLDGRLIFDNNDNPPILGSKNGEYVYDVGGIEYRVSGAQGSLDAIDLVQDITLYTFNDGTSDVGTAMIGDTITFNGEDYIISGTGIDDLELYKKHGMSRSERRDEVVFMVDGDFNYLADQAPRVTEDFEGGVSGWTDNSTTVANGTTILGGYYEFGANTTSQKTFTGIPQEVVTIEFDYYFIDSWEPGEYGWLTVNGQTLWEQDRDVSVLQPIAGYGRTDYPDYMNRFAVVYDNTAGSDAITLRFGSSLNSGSTDESWGIDNVKILSDDDYLYSSLEGYIFADGKATIDGTRCYVNSDDPENIVIEGPVSESIHVTEEEKAYMVEGTSSADVIITEMAITGDIADAAVVPITDEFGTTFYAVEDIDGTITFIDGVYPPLEAVFDGQHTTVSTHRVITLEDVEYKIDYDASTDTYSLHDGISDAIEGLVATEQGTYTTDIGGIVYSIKGTSANDFKLESVRDVSISAVSEMIIMAGNDMLRVTETSLTRPAITAAMYTTKTVIFGHAIGEDGTVFELQGAYYDITTAGSEYVLSDGTAEGTYTTTANGTEITVGEIEYAISVDGDDLIFIEVKQTIDAVANYTTESWIDAAGTYFKVIDDQDGSFTLTDGLGGSIDVASGYTTMNVGGMLYDVAATTATNFELSADCMSFDGNDYINTDTDFSWSKDEDFSMGFFVNPASLSGIQGILGKGEAGGYGTGNWEYSFKLNGSTLQFVYFNTGGSAAISFSTTVEQDEWAHIMVTYDGTQKVAKLYKDGVEVATDTSIDGTMQNRTTPMLIGHAYNSSNTNYYFDGKVDEVCVFNGTLSEGEVQTVMNDGLTGSETDLAAYYSFNAGDATDDSVNTNDGTVVDATAEHLTSRHLSEDSGITVYGIEFGVDKTAEGYALLNNQGSFTETAEGRIVIDDIRSFEVGEVGGELRLEQVMLADIDRDGDIDTADEGVLLWSLENGIYERAADLNLDHVVDEMDQALFRAYRTSTTEVGKYDIAGSQGKKDYYVTSSANGKYCFEDTVTGQTMFSNEDGTLIEDLDNMWYLISGTDLHSLTMSDDTRIFVFDNGKEVVAETAIGRSFEYGGEEYTVSGTGLDDLFLMSGSSVSGEELTDAAFILDEEVYAVSDGATLREDGFDEMEGDGWSSSVGTEINGNNILGGYGNFAGTSVSKKFTDLPKAVLTISFDYYFLDSWDNEYAYFEINGQQVWSHKHYYTSDEGVLQNLGNVTPYAIADYVGHFEVTYDNTEGSDTLYLRFKAGLNSGATDESWGIDNVEIACDAPIFWDGNKAFLAEDDGTVLVNGTRYYINETDPESPVLEGPAYETSHIAGKEKTYLIGGTGVDDLTLSEFKEQVVDSVAKEAFVLLDIDDQLVYYGVYTNTSGDMLFDDGIYPPVTADNTTLTTLRVIELEGKEYRITYEASTDTYDLYDEAGSVVTDLTLTAEGTYTTEIDSVVYGIVGTSADDFRLESVRDITVNGTDDETVVAIDGNLFKVTESELTRAAFTSTALPQQAVGVSLRGSAFDDVYYDVTTAGSEYVFSDGTVAGTYTSTNNGTEVILSGVQYSIDATTVAGELILEETQEIIGSELAYWISLDGTYYRVTQEGTTDTYYLDTDVEGETPIEVTAGYTTMIEGTEYLIVATGPDDLELRNFVIPRFSSRVSDWQITVKGEDFIVTDVSGDLVLINNTYSTAEDANGQIVLDPVRPFDVTGAYSTLQLLQEMISDVNNDGNIDAADETIIANAITGTYTVVADLNDDLVVDEDDLELFYTQWITT
ncbi:MAG: LamG-like jellyroll fold domain-containing protein, partial [Candidatus Omnitrophota bacterium]